MKKWSGYGIGAAVAAIIIAMFLFLRPEYGHAMHHGSADERVAFFTEFLAIVTAILATVSASQIFFFIRQDRRLIDSIDEAKKANLAATQSADAATKSTTIMDETSKMQLRCYIAVTLDTPHPDVKGGLEIKPAYDGSLNIEVKFYVKNNGQTPAYDVQSSVFLDIGTPSPHDRLSASKQVDTTPLSMATVNPGDAISVHREFKGHFNPTQISEVGQGRQQFYVYGQIKFTDTFEQPRWVKFQYFIVHSPSQDNDIYRQWEISEEGNYTSENADRFAALVNNQ